MSQPVLLFKEHSVSRKTVFRYGELFLMVRRYPDVYLPSAYEKNHVWMIYVKGKSGKVLYWVEERREFHYARFKVKQIAERLGIKKENVAFEDVSTDEEEKHTVEEFTEVINNG